MTPTSPDPLGLQEQMGGIQDSVLWAPCRQFCGAANLGSVKEVRDELLMR
jgi:hypothetical protein